MYSGYIPFCQEVACSTTAFPKKSNFEVVRHTNIFQSLNVKHFCEINLRLKKTLRAACFEPRSDKDENLQSHYVFISLKLKLTDLT